MRAAMLLRFSADGGRWKQQKLWSGACFRGCGACTLYDPTSVEDTFKGCKWTFVFTPSLMVNAAAQTYHKTICTCALSIKD